MSKKYAIGFICDPLDGFNREAETSLFLMREVDRLKHKIFICEPKDLFLKQNEVWGVVKQITMTGHFHCFYQILSERPMALKRLDTLFLRKDPPFDLEYLNHLLLLTKLEREVLCINSPTALLKHNEKLSALDFPFTPKTFVGSQIDRLVDWAKRQKRGVVVKPLGEAGGRGIHRIEPAKIENGFTKRILRRLTFEETVPILVQEYLPAAQNGDKRILLWRGKVLGQFRRIPKAGEFRANLHLGGKFQKCSLTGADRKVLQKLGPWSRREKLYFNGIDMIGHYLTEMNVTSPMGIREINALYGKKAEQVVIGDLLRQLS